MKEISFCENNLDFGTEEVKERIEKELTGHEIEVLSCLGNCGDCDDLYFAEVDGEIVDDETKDGLYLKLKKIIEE